MISDAAGTAAAASSGPTGEELEHHALVVAFAFFEVGGVLRMEQRAVGLQHEDMRVAFDSADTCPETPCCGCLRCS